MSDIPPLPFEYSIKRASIPEDPDEARRVLEQRDRELEDYLGHAQRNAGGATQVGARFYNNEGDSTTFGGFQSIYWTSEPIVATTGSDAHVYVEPGETYDRIHVLTAGLWTAKLSVNMIDGASFNFKVTVPNDVSGWGLAAGEPHDGSHSEKKHVHLEFYMNVDDYFVGWIDGPAAGIFAAEMYVEYVGP